VARAMAARGSRARSTRCRANIDALSGFDAEGANGDRPRADRARRTPNKGRLGANAVLGVSLAVAKAAANEAGQPL